jgi:4'-phosphopantetheinyl transferase
MTDNRRRRIVEAAARRTYGPALAPGRDGDILRAWVRLEATAKAGGTGIGRLLTEEGVVGGQMPAPERSVADQFDVRDLEVPDGHVAAVAAAASLPAKVDVAIFPRDADALARFLARSDA